MSGPDQVQDPEADNGHDHTDHQHQNSRLRISSLLCTVETAEPAKSAPWESPRTEAVHLEGHSQQSRSSSSPPRSPQRSWHTSRDGQRGDFEHGRHQEVRRYQTHPIPAHSVAPKSPVHSSPSTPYDIHHYPSTSSPYPIHHDSPVYVHTTSANIRDLRRPLEANERRDSGLGRRDVDARDAGYSPHNRSYGPPSRDHLSRNTSREHGSPYSTPPTASSSSVQRSASLHADHYQDDCHPYDADLRRSRTERSKSDFALHQQNYGPYLDASPLLASAPLFQTRKASLPSPSYDHHQNHNLPHGQPAPHPSQQHGPPSYFHDNASPTADHGRSPYPTNQDPRRSIQGDTRRSSQGILLPPPESLYSSAETRKPARIYGLDAADVPARPPLAPSASYGAKPLQDIPDESETEYSRRTSMQHSDSGYHQSREPTPRYNHYSYEHRPSTSSHADPDGGHPRYQGSAADRPQYSYRPQSPYSQPRPEPRPYSPGNDIQPPSWYHQYAHAVPYKPTQPPRSSFSHGDPHAYASSSRRGSEYGSMRNAQPQQQQQGRSSDQYPSRSSSFSAGTPAAAHGVDYSHHGQSSKPAVVSAKSRLSTSHSVHPFDIPADPPTSPSSTKAGGKRDRGQDDDPFVAEDGVKAKRKRANIEQLSILNAAFERSYFPSTEERLRLSKQTKMCPRTVQIWFQNKRQSVKARTDAMDAAVAAVGSGRRRGSQALSQAQDRSREQAEEKPSRKRSNEEMDGEHSRQQQQPSQQLHQQQQPHRRSPLGLGVQRQSEKRRSSGPLTPSDAVMASLHIQFDARDVDYFSRKRRATIAHMEQRDH
ncbi:hypothetical protein BGZ58_002538 [Dissophora ornata]|nr:hypothetical protein BGZ58_002538 [Dissophora ornata]